MGRPVINIFKNSTSLNFDGKSFTLEILTKLLKAGCIAFQCRL